MQTNQSPVLSTPTKSRLATRSQSRVSSNKVKEIYVDAAHDVDQAEKADFDTFLRFLLSCCLDGDARREFETLQTAIENLQAERYDDTDLRQTPRDTFQTGDQPQTTDHGVTRGPSVEETNLIGKREKLLNGVLNQCLEKVLDLANNDSVRVLLKIFGAELTKKSPEVDRYKPYTELCNKALDELGTMTGLPLRHAAPHSLRLSRADPLPIKSTYLSGESLERKPDLVHTSMSAAIATHDSVDFGDKPTQAFVWPQAYSSVEMKAFAPGISDRAQLVVDGKQFAGREELPRIPWHKKFIFFEPLTPETFSSSITPSTKSGSKRSRPNDDNDLTSSKKARFSNVGTDRGPGKDTLKIVDARVQLAGYAKEMMSYGPGIVRVINILIIDELLYIWYYDRHGMLYSEAISIIADFPRLLVLLLAFQRFRAVDWGIVPIFETGVPKNAQQSESTTVSLDFSLHADQFFNPTDLPTEGQLDIQPKQYLSHQPHCISGRATSVFKALYNQKPVACKLYSPEVQRLPEGDTLKTVRAIAEKKDSLMLKHLPLLYFSGDFQAGNTLRVRSMLGICGKGHRTLRMIVLEELVPLTSQTGQVLIDAWLDAVICHAFLWKHGVEHGDPSLWNVMYHPIHKCGVLTDFDLSIMTWLTRVPGTDRTGTLPFMSVLLLNTRYWDGQIPRFYYHELEAFIWMLPFVFLAYHDGKLDQQNQYIKKWLTSDYTICKEKKLVFLFEEREYAWSSITATCMPFEPLMSDTLRLVANQYTRSQVEELDRRIEAGRKGRPIPPPEAHPPSEAIWTGFINVLSRLHIDTTRLEKHKPIFNINTPQYQEILEEVKVIHASLCRDN